MAASSPSQSTAMQQQQGQLQALYNRFRDVLGGVFRERKPWGELVDRSSFARPANLAEATGRLRKNAHYFKVNYLMVVFTVTLITLAFNPTSLIVLGLLAMAWIYLFVVRQSPIVIGGRTFSDREKALGMAIVTLIVVFFLTSVAAVLFTAIGISFVAIALHGSLRVPDDLFTDEVELFLQLPAAWWPRQGLAAPHRHLAASLSQQQSDHGQHGGFLGQFGLQPPSGSNLV